MEKQRGAEQKIKIFQFSSFGSKIWATSYTNTVFLEMTVKKEVRAPAD